MYQISIMNKFQRLNILVIFLGPYPKGNVSTIRIHSYCKSLAKKGHFVKVLLIAPTTEASVNKELEGLFEGVHYKYMTDITWKKKNPSKLEKVYYYLLGIIKSIGHITNDQTNYLLSYHNEPISNVLYWLTTRKLEIPFVLDKTEYPKSYQEKSKVRHFIDKLFLKVFDGFIVISEELKAYYTSINNKTFLLPMTIDKDRFKSVQKLSPQGNYIAVVFGTHNRDGLDTSLKAYKRYVDMIGRDNAYKLKLIGDFQRLPNSKVLMKYIQDNELLSYVEILGKVDNSQVPSLLANASCLLTTPHKYISGGFPTKLGEYMLSGVITVATSVGEITKYVSNNKDILLSKPGDISGISNNLLYVHQNSDMARVIAQNAYQTALEKFNADSYIDNLISFLDELKK